MARYWLETDIADNVMKRVTLEFGVRRAAFLKTFRGHKFRCEPGAPYAWLTLPDHWKPMRFAAALHQVGVKVTPEQAFAIGGRASENHIRICFGQPNSVEELQIGLNKIMQIMTETIVDDFTPVA